MKTGIISRICAVVVITIAILVLIGWVFDIQVLKSVRPKMVGMNPLTASCFILSGICLTIRSLWGRWRRLGTCCAFLILSFGAVRLAGYLLNFDVQIDRFLFSEKLETLGVFPKNRMAPNTALGFIFSGAAMFVAGFRFRRMEKTSQCLAAATIFVSLLVLIGYMFGVSALYGVRFFIPMALHTALSFLFLGIGILFLHPRSGFMGEITGDNEGGSAARVFLPFAIGVPIFFCWMRIVGVKAGWFSVELGLALVAVMSVLVLTGVTVWMASMLNHQGEARKRAEKALRESEEHYRILFDSIDEGFCIFEMIYDENEKPVDYRFLQINPSFERQSGLKDAQGKRMRELAPQHESHWFEIYGKIVLTGQPVRFENRAEQLHRWFDVYAFRFGDPEKRQVAALFSDITGRKQGEEMLKQKSLELENSNKELEAFSYSVSHDLRAPLRAIDGFTKILEEDFSKDLDAEARRLLGVVRQNTRQMGQLIDDLLAFSRLSRKGVEKGQIDMTSMAHQVIKAQTCEPSSHPAQLEVGELPSADGDAAMIQQVWINLISNALKFSRTQARPQIEIRGTVEGNELVYCVKDNGVGFDMNYVNKLFGVFQRLHRADEFEGTGVGLAIVARIVHRHGGRVWAEARLDEGAAFYFTLPAKEAKP